MRIYAGVILCVLLSHTHAGPKSKLSPYLHVLQDADHMLVGRVQHDALKGSRIPAILDEAEESTGEETKTAEEEIYLRIVIDPSDIKATSPSMLSSKMATVDTGTRMGSTKVPQTTQAEPTKTPIVTTKTPPSTKSSTMNITPAATFARSASANTGESTEESTHLKSTESSTALSTSTNVVSSGTPRKSTTPATPTPKANVASELSSTTGKSGAAAHTHTHDGTITFPMSTPAPARTNSHMTGSDVMTGSDAADEPSRSLYFVIKESHAFAINKENYIVVNDSSLFEGHPFIAFYVYLADVAGNVVSNPLPFIVYIERPQKVKDEYPTIPAVFAGVLVLFIVFLALFIPFVTRAKRRYKQGKPMFRLGSVAAGLDLQAEPDMTRAESKEPNWYGNNAFNYEEEVEKEKKFFSEGIQRLSVKSQRNQEPPTLQLTKKQPKSVSTGGSDGSSYVPSTGAASYISDDESTQSSKL